MGPSALTGSHTFFSELGDRVGHGFVAARSGLGSTCGGLGGGADQRRVAVDDESRPAEGARCVEGDPHRVTGPPGPGLEGDGGLWRFLAIWSLNRWEYVVSMLAC